MSAGVCSFAYGCVRLWYLLIVFGRCCAEFSLGVLRASPVIDRPCAIVMDVVIIPVLITGNFQHFCYRPQVIECALSNPEDATTFTLLYGSRTPGDIILRVRGCSTR